MFRERVDTMNDTAKVPITKTRASTAKAPNLAAEREHAATSPRPAGKVWCCVTLGWVTPAEAFDHVWESDRGTGD
jgi:hypothetical protein